MLLVARKTPEGQVELEGICGYTRDQKLRPAARRGRNAHGGAGVPLFALAAWDRPGPVAMILGQCDYKPTFGLAECLGALSDPAALEPLTALLCEEDPAIRHFAADGIAKVADRATLRRLGDMAKRGDPKWPAEFFPPDRAAALQRASADERGCYVESDPLDCGRFDPPKAHWAARDVLKRLPGDSAIAIPLQGAAKAGGYLGPAPIGGKTQS